MKKYYSSSFLIEKNLLTTEEIDKTKYYYEVEFMLSLNCNVAKVYFQNEIKSIIFYDIDFNNNVLTYTLQNFGNIKIVTYHNLSDTIKITKTYNEGSLFAIWTYKYDIDYRLNISILQDSLNILIEYRQSVYDEAGNHIKEKIFFADSWTIHTEKMI